jgi:nitrite reductase/ring-hydroxylating ferredoxin subunit
MTMPATTDAVPAGLALAGVYTRLVRANLDRIWENVLDWEHLPALHATSFHAVALIAADDTGWRIRLVPQPGDASRGQILEVAIDRPAARYCARTLDGPGAGTEIWTRLTPAGPHLTEIEVRYYLPDQAPDKLAALGARYRSSYQTLWDEDERMMMHRQAMLDARRTAAPAAPVSLGPLTALRARLPVTIAFAGQDFRIVDLDGAVVAHATTCPHWLGPLDHVAQDGVIRCPWHGYRFDIRTGRSTDGKPLCLATPPRVVIDQTTDEVWAM